MAVQIQHRETMWVRHEQDQGKWWPAVGVGFTKSSSLLMTALRRRDSQEGALAPTMRNTNAAPAGQVQLFYLPSSDKLVAATESCPYDRSSRTVSSGMAPPPCAGGVKKCQEEAIDAMDSIIRSFQGAQQMGVPSVPAPVTPSQIMVGSSLSTITPASCSDSEFPIMDTSQASPSMSVSSTGTELEAPRTQFRDHLDTAMRSLNGLRAARSPGVVEWEGQLQEGGTTRTKGRTSNTKAPSGGNTREGVENGGGMTSPPRIRSGKRARSVSETEFLADDAQGIMGEISPAAIPAALESLRRKKECLESRQYPRFRSSPASASGSLQCGEQCANDANEDMGVETVGDGVSVSDDEESETGGTQIEDQGDEATIYNNDNTEREQSSSHTYLQRVPVTFCSRERSNADLEEMGGVSTVDAKAEEAEAFRRGGIIGEENFSALSRKLIKLKWRWGPPVDKMATSSDRWLMKPGAKARTAVTGVDRFEPNEHVVQYVRDVLGFGDICEDEEEENDSASEGEASDDEAEAHKQGKNGSPGDSVAGEDEGMERNMVELRGQKIQQLEEALEALTSAKAPQVVSERKREFSEVLQFLESGAETSSGGSMYLCGCPGTGKSLTMSLVQAAIENRGAKAGLQIPKFHYFVGTGFTDPKAMHDALWCAISGKRSALTSVEKALSDRLARRGKSANSPMVVVVVDEIDQLKSRNRQVLRKLFEWADAPRSRMLLVGIANSMGFDVGFSDLKRPPVKICFPAYSPVELSGILHKRVCSVIDKGAINLCSKKVAATHGDARRAINMCRDAISIAKQALQDCTAVEEVSQGKAPVTISHMQQALRAARSCRHGDAMEALSLQAQIVLCVAAASVAHDADRPDGAIKVKRSRLTQGILHEKCMRVWAKSRTGGGLSQIEFSEQIDNLASQGLLDIRGKQHGGRARELALHVEFSDVEIALGNQPFFKAITG